ncbi:hypothetical protein [Corallococcus sp. 4LFB]|uniref:hypothetical protein n=1 Tax=Corallococcus sp. 4LFB TaxID=3383249 RepID=UPI003975467C
MSESEKKRRRQRRSFRPEFMAGAVKLVLEEVRCILEHTQSAGQARPAAAFAR